MSTVRRRLRHHDAASVRGVRRTPGTFASTGWARTLVVTLVGTEAALLVGGVAGAVAGVVLGLLLRRFLAGLEPRAARVRRERVVADLPLAVDLLVVCLRAGRPVGGALGAVADAVGGPLGADLARWSARLELGGDPRAVWDEAAAEPVLGVLGRALVRASDTGAAPADGLTHLVDDLQRDRVSAAEEAARRVAVRSAGPLGLCFLPAFVLVGVAPTIIGAFSTMLG